MLIPDSPPPFSLSPPSPVCYQGAVHEDLYTVLRLADLSMVETAEFNPGGAPLDPGDLKTDTIQ